jgi:hypothetical protein
MPKTLQIFNLFSLSYSFVNTCFICIYKQLRRPPCSVKSYGARNLRFSLWWTFGFWVMPCNLVHGSFTKIQTWQSDFCPRGHGNQIQLYIIIKTPFCHTRPESYSWLVGWLTEWAVEFHWSPVSTSTCPLDIQTSMYTQNTNQMTTLQIL